MKITKIKYVGRKPVYDLSVGEVEHYVLKNGVVTHNTGIYYSANQIFIISRSQEKDNDGLAGFKFTINIEKSRYVKEKSKLPFTVLMNKGIQKWSGLFDLALESGHITNAKKGWYQIVDMTTGEVEEKSYRSKELENNDEFFKKLSADPTFREFIETRFKLTAKGTDIDDGSDEDIDSDDDE
jgi:hypothetical protein